MLIAAIALTLASAAQDGPEPEPYAIPGEDTVDPYKVSPANAGATPFAGLGMARAFNGQDGIRRIVDRFVTANFADRKVGEIFMNQDKVRLKRTLFEHFCYILNAGCIYTGRDMKSAHKDMGIQQADMNRVVENLQTAMRAEGVPFAAQNRFLAKLTPMRRDVVGR